MIMRLLAILFIFAILAGTVFAGCGCASAKAVDVGSSVNSTDLNDTDGPSDPTAVAAKNKSKDKNETEIKNQTGKGKKNVTVTAFESNETETEANETELLTENGKPKKGKGISTQVKQIIEARKNGSITVPQGMIVRIIAKNHSLSVEDAIAVLDQTLVANVKIHGKNKSLVLEPDDETVNITDENVTVTTNETIEIVNETLSVGGKKVLVMPSSVPKKIKTKTIKSAVLHVANGDPVYQVNATRKARVMWIFETDMDVETTLDAVNGKIKNEKRPWWSFMASVEEDEEE